MTGTSSCAVIVFLVCLLPGGMAQVKAGSFKCEVKGKAYYGNPFTITARIDHSKYPALCTGSTPQGKPSFQSSKEKDTGYSSKCSVADDITQSCSFTSGLLGCGCVNSNENGSYVVEYNLIASRDTEPYWKVELSCLGAGFAQAIYFSGKCHQTFDEEPDDKTDFYWTLGVAIFVVVFCVIAIVILAIFVYKLRKRKGHLSTEDLNKAIERLEEEERLGTVEIHQTAQRDLPLVLQNIEKTTQDLTKAKQSLEKGPFRGRKNIEAAIKHIDDQIEKLKP